MTATPDLSVVIGFRDWGLDRLAANVRMHLRHAGPVQTEVVVSDYGSADPAAVRDAVEAAGGRIARTDTDEPWNRSAALNAGVEAARARAIVTTDADILFTPAAYVSAIGLTAAAPDTLNLIQCRDLPSSFGVEHFAALLDRGEYPDFETLRRHAFLRPRWGMGGFAAFSRQTFFALNGYEERMKLWGSEDNDFAKRFRLLGMPTRWIVEPEAVIFHMWHEPSHPKANGDLGGRATLQENRRILKYDPAPVRNLARSFARPEPLVSVVIPTWKRPEYLRQALESCLAQNFGNFEAIVVENGGAEDAEDVVADLGDARLRFIRTERKGAAAARNIGNAAACGRFIVIHDDDDIMVSTRLSDHLAALEGGVQGSYGGWIDFAQEDGKILATHPGKAFDFPTLITTGKVLTHGCLMLDARIYRLFSYDETLVSGIDYGFLLRLAFMGLQLNHTGSFGLLRRMHGTNMTVQSVDCQKAAARSMADTIRQTLRPGEYEAFRKSGRAAAPLPCSNERAAVAELGLYGFSPDPGHTLTSLVDAPTPSAASVPDVQLDREVFAASGLFDPDWYAEAYPDVALVGLDPLDHFLRYGRTLGRRPGPDFDPLAWRAMHPELPPAADPLAHFMATRRDG